MATEIKVWQIVNGTLENIKTSMIDAERKETEDLEKWIKTNPAILGEDISLIGEQVQTKSGPTDLLGIDQSGNIVIIELKRDRLPREALAQAVDYASDIASWDLERLNEVCLKFNGQSLEDFLNENITEVDIEDIPLNKNQRMLLVGFSIEESLQRMIEWLSNNYGVSINAIVLKYIKTNNNEELLAKTVIIPEEVEKERSKKGYIISISDEPGNYEPEELKELLIDYLSENRPTPRRIRETLLPLCLQKTTVTREAIKKELMARQEASDEGKAGLILTTISREIGIKKRDYLRQILRYERPNPWEKENYRLLEKYKELVENVLKEVSERIKK